MENYLKLKTFSPFSSSYVFLDCDEYLADQLFIKHKVPVKFGGEFVRDDSRYRIISCTIRKKYEQSFLKALSEMLLFRTLNDASFITLNYAVSV